VLFFPRGVLISSYSVLKSAQDELEADVHCPEVVPLSSFSGEKSKQLTTILFYSKSNENPVTKVSSRLIVLIVYG
jgi:hypothetical protein